MSFLVGNYIISLGDLSKWLSDQASDLGVDIFPGFAADEVSFIYLSAFLFKE